MGAQSGRATPEAERQARERDRLARGREKARLQEHLESQQRATERKTADVERQAKALDEVLTSVLSLPRLSFEGLMVSPRVPQFDPGPLGLSAPMPNW